MELKFNPMDPKEAKAVLQFLKVSAPALWSEVALDPNVLDATTGLSVRTRSKLQEHGIHTTEKLFSYTRDMAIQLLGQVIVSEIEAAEIGKWNSDP